MKWAWSRRPGWDQACRVGLALAVVSLTTSVLHRESADRPWWGDERHHLRQIEMFCGGEYQVYGKLTTIPGYHALVALLGRTGGGCSLRLARGANAVFGLLCVVIFLLAARRAAAALPTARALQFYFLPILLPYHFLAYTDLLSLLLVLGSLLLLLRGCPAAAGGVGALSLLVRQNNVAWLAFICLYLLVEERLWKGWRGKTAGYLRRAWPSLLGIAAFAGFLAANGSVVLHEKGAHRVGLHSENVFAALSLYCLLFLPSVLASLWIHRDRLADLRLMWLLALGYLLFVWSFHPDHPYNEFDGFLRNDVLRVLNREPAIRLAFYLPAAAAMAALWLDGLRWPSLALVYPLALGLLVPAWVIEARYYFVPYTLLLLFRKDQSPFVETLGVAYSGMLAGAALYGVLGGRFGL